MRSSFSAAQRMDQHTDHTLCRTMHSILFFMILGPNPLLSVLVPMVLIPINFHPTSAIGQTRDVNLSRTQLHCHTMRENETIVLMTSHHGRNDGQKNVQWHGALKMESWR